VTDRRTDGQTDGRTDRITITDTVQTASHGKNCSLEHSRTLVMTLSCCGALEIVGTITITINGQINVTACSLKI